MIYYFVVIFEISILLCSSGCPGLPSAAQVASVTQQSSCLRLPGTRIINTYQHSGITLHFGGGGAMVQRQLALLSASTALSVVVQKKMVPKGVALRSGVTLLE